MAQTTRTDATTEPLPPDPYPDYPAPYTFFFQSWLIMFMAVICIALTMYLLTYIP
jgi:hypothetical protein